MCYISFTIHETLIVLNSECHFLIAFCSGYNERMRGFDNIFDSRSPFLALEHGDSRDRHRTQELSRHSREPRIDQRRSELVPARPFTDPFGFMDSMIPNINDMMGNMFRQMVMQ